jgi:hypothetical protein
VKRYVWLLWLDDKAMYEPTSVLAGVYESHKAARAAIPREIARRPYCGFKRKHAEIVKTEVET